MVQGVGFRPTVYNYALKKNLVGTVCNSSDGLHIVFNSNHADEIVKEILNLAPPLSYIKTYDLQEIAPTQLKEFKIIESNITTETNLPLTPDFAMCKHCKAEMEDQTNRRYNYPFITCTQCGPRFSITNTLPYDRHCTSMKPYTMCEDCSTEYENVLDRRFFSQTNSCSTCGIQLRIVDVNKNVLAHNNKDVLQQINTYLKQGKILAVKGVGGFLLVCDAANSQSIRNLRIKKHRPTKPFALLCKDAQQIRLIAKCNKQEIQELQSVAAPIVLLKQSVNCSRYIAVNHIAPALNNIGVMLPCAPLLQIIANNFNNPLIATSANISGSPIIFTNDVALENLFDIVDFIVLHDREIVTPQDDSVVQFTEASQKIILRRARGFAPSFFTSYFNKTEATIAMGALMKSSFTLLQKENIYISQYLGSTELYDAQETFKQTVKHFVKLTNAAINTIIIDKHKGYFSSELGARLAQKWNASLFEVQHHKAHFAALLAENNLMQHKGPVLGVIWDGTGLGDDGQIWGGEFFAYKNNTIMRCNYFDYFPVLMQDKMAKEPRLSALAICNDIVSAQSILRNQFTLTEWKLYNAMLKQTTSIQTSSVGRIFDAVAALLNLCKHQTYEGEAALYLQNLAMAYFETNGWDFANSYLTEEKLNGTIPTKALLEEVLADIENGCSPQFIAAKFHYSLVHIIKAVANNMGVKKIGLSGGVFQNALLVTLLQQHLGNTYTLFFHKNLSPNDENISFGQLAYWANKIQDVSKMSSKNEMQLGKEIAVK